MRHIKKQIGKNLKNLRTLNHYTQERAAKLLSLTESEYRQLERGKKELTYCQIYQLCEAYDVTADEIFKFEK